MVMDENNGKEFDEDQYEEVSKGYGELKAGAFSAQDIGIQYLALRKDGVLEEDIGASLRVWIDAFSVKTKDCLMVEVPSVRE